MTKFSEVTNPWIGLEEKYTLEGKELFPLLEKWFEGWKDEDFLPYIDLVSDHGMLKCDDLEKIRMWRKETHECDHYYDWLMKIYLNSLYEKNEKGEFVYVG